MTMRMTHSSGIRGVREWFTNDTNIRRTLSTIQVLTAEFSRSFYNNTVIAIELINEPFPYIAAELDILKNYYEAGYETVRSNDGASKVVVAIDEGFQGLQTWEAFMQGSNCSNIAMNTVSPIIESIDCWQISIYTQCRVVVPDIVANFVLGLTPTWLRWDIRRVWIGIVVRKTTWSLPTTFTGPLLGNSLVSDSRLGAESWSL